MKHQMKENELTEIENENKNILTLEKARELLGDNVISDEKLEIIISNIKVFCKVAYEMYSEEQSQKLTKDNVIELHPNQELKNAA